MENRQITKVFVSLLAYRWIILLVSQGRLVNKAVLSSEVNSNAKI